MRLIAIDMDGTLLNSNKEISPENLEALHAALDAGVEVVIATGRFHLDAWSILKRYPFRHWLISSNGAALHDPAGRLLESHAMEADSVREALTWLDAENYYFEIATDRTIHAWLHNRPVLEEELDRLSAADPSVDTERLRSVLKLWASQKGYRPITTLEALLAHREDWHNILVISFDAEKRQAGMNRFIQEDRVTVSTSWRYNFELMAPSVSKGNAVEGLGCRLGIPLSEMAAIGDNHNDLSMLTRVGTGVAMGNAEEAIRSRCAFVTDTHDAHGVAQAIRRLLSLQA